MIYFLKRKDGLVKIGTTKQYHQRLALLKVKYGDLELLGYLTGSHVEESALHRRFKQFKHDKDGKEWFHPSAELLEYIELNTKSPTSDEFKEILADSKMKNIPVHAHVHKVFYGFAYALDSNLEDALCFALSKFGLSSDIGPAERFDIARGYQKEFEAWKAQITD